MPNGHDRNWRRVELALEGFRQRHGHWPTCVRLSRGYIDEFSSHLFSEEAWSRVCSKLEFVADEDAPIVAEDADGRTYSYGAEGGPDQPVDEPAEMWLQARPDRGGW